MDVSTYPYDTAELLNSHEAIAAYAEDVLAENDPDLIRRAVSVVARAKGYLLLAEAAGLDRDFFVDALHDEAGGLEALRTALSATSRSQSAAAA